MTRRSLRLNPSRTSRVLAEFRNSGNRLEIMRRSLLGLVSVYNLLPESIVQHDSVQEFQSVLQQLMKTCVSTRGVVWFRMCSPGGDFTRHLLREL